MIELITKGFYLSIIMYLIYLLNKIRKIYKNHSKELNKKLIDKFNDI